MIGRDGSHRPPVRGRRPRARCRGPRPEPARARVPEPAARSRELSARCAAGPAGRVNVAVRLRERPFPAVVADMVEGVIVANGLEGTEATRARTALWAAVVADADLADEAA